MPTVIPDCSVPVEIQAERIRLRRLFDQVIDVVCDVEINADREPLALNVLTEWAHEHGWGLERIHHEGNADVSPFTIWRVTTWAHGKQFARISVYVMAVPK